MAIHDPTGAVLSDYVPLPGLNEIDPIGADLLYSPERNLIYEISTGNIVWNSSNLSTGVGAVSGSCVVFASGAGVLSEAF